MFQSNQRTILTFCASRAWFCILFRQGEAFRWTGQQTCCWPWVLETSGTRDRNGQTARRVSLHCVPITLTWQPTLIMILGLRRKLLRRLWQSQHLKVRPRLSFQVLHAILVSVPAREWPKHRGGEWVFRSVPPFLFCCISTSLLISLISAWKNAQLVW